MIPFLYSTCPHNEILDPGRSVNYTMWESTRISSTAVERCNQLRAVIVPCEAVATWFRNSGVVAPIRIVPLAIDTGIYHPGTRFDTSRFDGLVRFGCAGRTAHGGIRKGLDTVIRCFVEAFPDNPDVRLDVKCWEDCNVYDSQDPRVNIIRTALSTEALADWYRSLDCFVSASRGEGWGLQPHQAMACGTPALAPFWGGHKAYMTDDTCYRVEYQEQPAEGPIYGGLGNWCVTDSDSMIFQMRSIVANLDLVAEKGKLSSQRAVQFTWERTGLELLQVLQEFSL